MKSFQVTCSTWNDNIFANLSPCETIIKHKLQDLLLHTIPTKYQSAYLLTTIHFKIWKSGYNFKKKQKKPTIINLVLPSWAFHKNLQDVVKEYCKTELSNTTQDKSQREIPFPADLIGNLSRKVIVHPWLSQEEGRVPYCSNDLTYYNSNYYCNHTARKVKIT